MRKKRNSSSMRFRFWSLYKRFAAMVLVAAHGSTLGASQLASKTTLKAPLPIFIAQQQLSL